MTWPSKGMVVPVVVALSLGAMTSCGGGGSSPAARDKKAPSATQSGGDLENVDLKVQGGHTSEVSVKFSEGKPLTIYRIQVLTQSGTGVVREVKTDRYGYAEKDIDLDYRPTQVTIINASTGVIAAQQDLKPSEQ